VLSSLYLLLSIIVIEHIITTIMLIFFFQRVSMRSNNRTQNGVSRFWNVVPELTTTWQVSSVTQTLWWVCGRCTLHRRLCHILGTHDASTNCSPCSARRLRALEVRTSTVCRTWTAPVRYLATMRTATFR